MDRVSSLPEELLCHVLSFLTTKEAALTSILSKRWRYLFAFVPNLKFDNSVFLHDPEESNREKKKGIRQSFVDFVDRVLALQGDSIIEKFFLKCKLVLISQLVNQWICNVLRRGVLDMDLSIDLGQERCMFVETFMSTTVVELKLGSGCRISFRPGLISLPMLKTLTLVDSGLSDSGQLQMLLSACPALEALELTNVRWCYADATVSSASLKTLTIGSANSLHTLSFDTPNLLCLNHSALVREDYPLVNLEKLVEAHIKLDRGISMYDNVPKLLSGICSVQKLYLSPGTLEVLGLCCQAMPVFNNLTFLDIESNMNILWKAMPVLLKNCPHLETLVMKGGLVHCITDYCGDACTCKSRKEKGRSLTSCPVKRLEIREFQGRSIEMDMIKHFLDYFPCLKDMEIYVEDGRPEHLAPITFDSPYNHLSGRNVKIKVHDSLT
ncbi:PREDICTED: LOW QUALITY PROTEIN: putative F-box/LRR-repeat protein At3g58880 [Camelina sativa]|uniref:LOW QUALITY PROTEIN: putative F-box/LRR-repeat protein At3g58880 n=1 Tax=Camelina sativa TaxID=90675 RepID=A0ABM1RLR3_CAMSA|nr:PREDICTED: LOW QUALITY PROTEIN: putative F-box/LRR-repeat protein At3g58880 [Camelina sativa]